MKTWQLYIRHGHRDVARTQDDSGLSERGRQEIRDVVDKLRTHWPERKIQRILHSPKRRCQESAEILAGALGLTAEICDALNEQQAFEGEGEFRDRLSQWAGAHEDQPGLCVLSHGDVLPQLAALSRGPAVNLRTGGFFWLVDKAVQDIHT